MDFGNFTETNGTVFAVPNKCIIKYKKMLIASKDFKERTMENQIIIF